MKATRILLFLSPLLYFMPPLVNVDDTLGLMLLNGLVRGLIGYFPANALMALLCYSYAHQLGRDSWMWVVGSLRFPFIAPFILAFMPAKYGSAGDEQQRGQPRVAPTKAAVGPFESRFPLLSAYLASQPPAVATEPRTRFDALPANFEFSAFVDPAGLNDLLAGAATRQLTVWTNAEDSGLRVFGSGIVAPAAVDTVTDWVRQVAPKRKVGAVVHLPEGRPKFFEYYPSAD